MEKEQNRKEFRKKPFIVRKSLYWYQKKQQKMVVPGLVSGPTLLFSHGSHVIYSKKTKILKSHPLKLLAPVEV